jgi:hypothetical protein
MEDCQRSKDSWEHSRIAAQEIVPLVCKDQILSSTKAEIQIWCLAFVFLKAKEKALSPAKCLTI